MQTQVLIVAAMQWPLSGLQATLRQGRGGGGAIRPLPRCHAPGKGCGYSRLLAGLLACLLGTVPIAGGVVCAAHCMVAWEVQRPCSCLRFGPLHALPAGQPAAKFRVPAAHRRPGRRLLQARGGAQACRSADDRALLAALHALVLEWGERTQQGRLQRAHSFVEQHYTPLPCCPYCLLLAVTWRTGWRSLRRESPSTSGTHAPGPACLLMQRTCWHTPLLSSSSPCFLSAYMAGLLEPSDNALSPLLCCRRPDSGPWRAFSILSGGQQALATLALCFALQVHMPGAGQGIL